MTVGDSAPHQIDLHVGGRVRTRRKLLGLSQTHLARHIGVTFQQMQKYENGANRISCSKLFEISVCLGCPPAYFFEGLPEMGEDITTLPEVARARHALVMTTEGVQMADLFPRIASPRKRKKVLELIKLMAEDS